MSEIASKSEEQKIAEGEVDGYRQALGPFVVAAETTRMAMLFTDANEADSPIIFANASFLALTGYDREEVLGQKFNFRVAHRDDAHALRQVAAMFKASLEGDPESNFRRKDGSEFFTATFISPVRDESGSVVQHFVSFVDQQA